MLKELNILGIRKKTIVARFDKAQIAVMEAIDEKLRKILRNFILGLMVKKLLIKIKYFYMVK